MRHRYGLVSGLPLCLGLLSFPVSPTLAIVEDRPGKAGLYAKEIEAMVVDRQAATMASPNSWRFFLAVMSLSQHLTTDFFAGSQASDLRGQPAGWEGEWPFSMSEVFDDPTNAQARAEANRLLERLDKAKVFALLDELAMRDRFIRPIPIDKAMLLQLPELGQARGLVRTCIGQFDQAVQQGDQAAMLRSFRHCIAISRPLAMQSTHIDHLVAIAIQALVYDRVLSAAVSHKLPSQTLRELLATSDQLLVIPNPVFGASTEFLGVKDTVEWSYTDDGAGDGQAIVDAIRTIVGQSGDPQFVEHQPTRADGYATKAELMLKLDEIEKATITQAEKTYRQRMETPPFSEYLAKIDPQRYAVAVAMNQTFDNYLAAIDHFGFQLAATKLALAVELHHAETGAWPAALADLKPVPLADLKIPDWQLAEFRYEQIRGEDRSPVGYSLYAVGADNEDNDGELPADMMTQQALRRNARGVDAVYVPLHKR